MLGYMLATAMLSLPATSAGVQVREVPRVGIATLFATCIAREVGVLPATGRDETVRTAAKVCRDNLDRQYAAGNFKMNGKPQSKGWWKANGGLFDGVAADAAAFAKLAPENARLKVLWRYPDGQLIEISTAPPTPSRHIVFAVDGSVG